VAAASFIRDPELARQLDTAGYAVVPLLDEATVGEVCEAYREIAPPGDHGLAIDYMRPDRTVMRRLRERLEPVWSAHLPQLFVDPIVAMCTMVTKHPGDQSGMFLHEDRTFVDESRTRAYTVWVPLVPVGPGLDNGGLQIVPGSHRLPTGLAGSNTPDLIRPFEDELRRHLVDVAAGAGDAVVYDTRTLHASRPNLTDVPRPALTFAVVPGGEAIVHVVASSPTHRRVHAVGPDFFVDHHPREIEVQMPEDCPVIDEFDVDDPSLTAEDVARVLG
jgi:ectoine hydroxylase-related dioxygenase (phytanoyl-CoA dioxygenase family)